jgi:transcriptional regulator with XRE-family HTH domain
VAGDASALCGRGRPDFGHFTLVGAAATRLSGIILLIPFTPLVRESTRFFSRAKKSNPQKFLDYFCHDAFGKSECVVDKNTATLDTASSCGDICRMIATAQQIRMVRAALRLSQADVAVRSGLSLTGYNDVEAERSSPRAATLGRIQEVLEREGARFTSDGSVRIVPKGEQFIVPSGQNPDEETVLLAKAIVNASRRAKGMTELS